MSSKPLHKLKQLLHTLSTVAVVDVGNSFFLSLNASIVECVKVKESYVKWDWYPVLKYCIAFSSNFAANSFWSKYDANFDNIANPFNPAAAVSSSPARIN